MVTGIEAQRPWMHTCVWSRKSQTLRCSENHNRVHHGCGSLRKMSKVKNHLWETSNGCSEEFLTGFSFFHSATNKFVVYWDLCVLSGGSWEHTSHTTVLARVFLTWMHARRLFMLNENTLCFFISQMKRENANRKQVCHQHVLIRLNRHFLELFQPKGCFNSNLFGIGSYYRLLVAVNLKLLVIRRGNVETIFLFCFLLPCHIF